jgi:hypothetical protein
VTAISATAALGATRHATSDAVAIPAVPANAENSTLS